ncbi:NADPH:quinone oxidoreductase family protein [Knoellia subterranea]|uniref:NADPH:quinone oxidoreductase n=1 Tax=Knoellia subterranea KCTC 19937 TaxID=1385521 RepID=A0A0A0JL55_9MICO|nr:NADPH:quinone oxidoreductase family protein [Knoellia subterranea]KGN37848.1 NADPH:quinone oxidoreductase [Knoellia subterranea KCTC 19937]
MRAAQVTRLDGPDAVEVGDVPNPEPAAGEVLIDVAAAGVTFPDVLISRGEYQIKPPLPFVPGSEVAGVVQSAPAGSGLEAGDRVAAFPFLGGFAEQVVCDPSLVFPLPDSVSFEQGAALPMNYLTCHFALRVRGRLAEGEKVLVHGAAGGIGTAAIQLAKAWGATVYAVVSDSAKADVARSAGADDVVLADGFREAVADLTSGRGVDIVVDPVGGDRFTDSLRSLAALGRLLVIGFTAGAIPEVKVNRLLLNNIDVVGVGWGAFWTGGGADPSFVRRQWDELVPLLEAGKLDPVIGSVRSLDEMSVALRDIDERRATGKILLTP